MLMLAFFLMWIIFLLYLWTPVVRIKKYSTKASVYKTPVIMVKKLGSPSGERTIAFVFLQSIIIAVVIAPFLLCAWNRMS